MKVSDLLERPSRTWHLLPGKSAERDDFLKVLKSLLLNCNEIKIAAAYLSNTRLNEFDLGDSDISAAFEYSSEKVSILQIDSNPGITLNTAHYLANRFSDRLRIVTTGSIRTKSHHKVVVFYMDDVIYHLSGSMNFTRNGLDNNGESVTLTQYNHDKADKEDAEGIFSIYEENPSYLFDIGHDFSSWFSFISENEKRYKAEKEATAHIKEPAITTEHDRFKNSLNNLVSHSNPMDYSKFVETVYALEKTHPGTLECRRQASNYLISKLQQIEKLDMSTTEDQVILKQLLGKLKKGDDGTEYGALGVIHFTKLMQPKGKEALDLYKNLIIAISKRDVITSNAISTELAKMKRSKSTESSTGPCS